MDRTVRRIESNPTSRRNEPQALSAYDSEAGIVLLGDPGAGKTHTFRECAARTGGRYVTARAFLVAPATKRGETLFIDGLDEKRAGRSDRDTVDALVEKLFAAAPSKVRISCRVADWLGDSDLAALRPYFELNGDPVILQLHRLSAEEQRAVLAAENLSTGDAEAFLRKANERALGEFLENPQNLIMLLRAVQAGTWPATRRELFELSTQIMLKEFDKERARSASGVYSADELRPAAGAVFAARLISDIEAISLADHEGSKEIPSYRSLGLIPPERVMAALGRRVFVAGPVPESVDYAHRTMAEYLGGAWLAETVRNGLPFGRLQALMGIDGHPASELRGLHAWLATFLPEHAARLIDSDPYGVLTYGDAASLSPSSCAHLVEALGRLSQTDPWFRSGNGQSPAIGALARTDMVDAFRAVLRSDNAGFGVRSIVVEAAALGAPMPALKDDLFDVVLRTQSPYGERLYALVALLRIGSAGAAAVVAAFHKLGAEVNELRLRAEIIQRLYGNPFGSAEVVKLLTDIAEGRIGENISGVLWSISDQMRVSDIPAVLDGLEPGKDEFGPGGPHEWELGRFIDRILIRAWREIADVDSGRALTWLGLRSSYSRSHRGGRTDDLRAAVKEQPERLRAIAARFFETLVVGKDRWWRLTRFREITFHLIAPDELLQEITPHLTRAAIKGEKERFLYEMAFALAFSMDGVPALAAFEWLVALADQHAELRDIRNRSLSCEVPSGLLERRRPGDDAERDPEAQQRDFERDTEAIRSGTHLGWLTWSAKIYFCLFRDVDERASPRERLVANLGETNTQAAIDGFIAVLSRRDLPSLEAVVALTADRQHYEWWYAITAGLIEQWNTTQSLDGVSDELVKAMLVFDLANPVYQQLEANSQVIVPGWKTALIQDRPQLAREAYTAIARAKLAKADQMVDGLRELMVEEAFKPFRAESAIELLREFPNADPFRLDELFSGVLRTPAAHSGFLDLAQPVLTGAVQADQRQHDMWLATAYLLAPMRYQADLDANATQRPSIVFHLRDHTGYGRDESQQPGTLPLPQLEFLARLAGRLYPETGFPTGVFGGDTNAWDAAEYCRQLINAISAVPSGAGTVALKQLEANPQLASYNLYIRHALSNQEKRRRESEYDRPDWASTIKALAKGAPATVADLHALLVHQLDDLGNQIARENTDLYKSFWNIDRYSRPKTPRPEETCRDTLVTLLRPVLAPNGVMVEPEGHMVADRRADISAAMPRRKVLCELKRDYHADLWTAADQQLEQFYVHDPNAKGFGVYAVFWFGPRRPARMPGHPDGLKAPTSAAELREMLLDRIPADRRHRLAVVVIDVAGPELPKKKSKRTAKKIVKKPRKAKRAHARRKQPASPRRSVGSRRNKKASRVWAKRIEESVAKTVWAYFNNDRDGYAIKNARALSRLLLPSRGHAQHGRS